MQISTFKLGIETQDPRFKLLRLVVNKIGFQIFEFNSIFASNVLQFNLIA